MSLTDPSPGTTDLGYSGLDALDTLLGSGELTSVRLVEALLARAADLDQPGSGIGLRAILAIAPDAVDQARARDAERSSGRLRGPLHGVPVLVKDNIEAVGLPGSAGSLALADRAVAADAPLVGRLREAGAVVLGAANLSEWANFRSPDSTSGWSALGGLTGNPWALDRSAGGSSSGSGAAVAAGLAPLAVGTETNGSITCPASVNGVVGLKPTVGSVPSAGIAPISASQDAAGPLARTVRDAAVLLEVLSGATGLASACDAGRARRLHVAVAEGWATGHDRTDALVDEALRALAAHVAGIQGRPVPAPDHGVADDQVTVLVAELADDLDAYLRRRPGSGVASLAELVAFNVDHAEVELAHFGQQYFERSLASGGRAGPAYAPARERNLAWAQGAYATAFAAGASVVAAPAYAPAWKSDLAHVSVLGAGGASCMAPSILGWPVLTVPVGLVDGLPVGLALTGAAGSERDLIAVGHALEQALGLAASLRPTWRPPARG